MKQTVNKEDFMHAFHAYNRHEQFGYDALSVLFDYYEQLEDDIGEEIELDVIAICCDWSLYTPEEIQEQYDMDVETLRDNTTVLNVDDDIYLVQSF